VVEEENYIALLKSLRVASVYDPPDDCALTPASDDFCKDSSGEEE